MGMSPLTVLAPAYNTSNEYAVITTVTTANTFGPWTQIGTLPPYKTNRLFLTGRPFSGNTSQSGMINIGIGPPGSQVVVVPYMLANAITEYGGPPLNYLWPIKLPPGMAVWAQYATPGTAADNFEIGGYVWQEPDGWECTSITPYVDSAASQGFSFDITADGAWGPVTITSSSSRHKKYAFSFTTLGEPGSWISAWLEILMGSQVLFQKFCALISNGGNSTICTPTFYGPFDCDIPAGQTITAQGDAHIGAACSVQIAFYGMD